MEREDGCDRGEILEDGECGFGTLDGDRNWCVLVGRLDGIRRMRDDDDRMGMWFMGGHWKEALPTIAEEICNSME